LGKYLLGPVILKFTENISTGDSSHIPEIKGFTGPGPLILNGYKDSTTNFSIYYLTLADNTCPI
jgi:hypothetical protein